MGYTNRNWEVRGYEFFNWEERCLFMEGKIKRTGVIPNPHLTKGRSQTKQCQTTLFHLGLMSVKIPLNQ